VAKRTPFSGKTHSILHQNASRIAPNSPKTGVNGGFWEWIFILPHAHANPLFASKQTFARIDFLRQDGRLVVGKGTQNVKMFAEKWTK